MKFEFEIECKVDTDSKKKSELLSNVKKKAMKLASKALDCAIVGMLVVDDVVDKAGDALLEAAIAVDEKMTENNSVDDSDEDDEDDEEEDEEDEEDDEDKEDEPEDKTYTLWEYLDKTCNYEVDSSVKTVDVEKEVNKFFEAIGYEANECTIKAFITSVTLKKITYTTVTEKLKEYFSSLTDQDIKLLLKDDFNDWLKYIRPDVKESCPSANFILLLKYFVRKVRAS